MKSLSAIKILCLGLLMTGLVACEKDSDPIEAQVQIAEDEALAEAYFSLVINEAGSAWASANVPTGGGDPEIVTESESTLSQQPSAPVTTGDRLITIRNVTGQSQHPGFPVEVTVDFRNWKVGEGPVKNGIIRLIATGPIHLAGTSISLTYHNFRIDGHLVEGSKTLTNINGLTFNLALSGGKITFVDGSTITRTSNITRTWTAGIGTPLFIWDDEFSISGTTSGTTRRGVEYSLNITKPLIHRMSCLWLVEGAITVTHGQNSFVLDYGNGVCDNLATVTANGITKEITLPRTPPAR